MSDIHLITAIAKKYGKMTVGERIKKIKKLVAKSATNDAFVRKYFPEFYSEAFPSTCEAGGNWESAQPAALYAKTH